MDDDGVRVDLARARASRRRTVRLLGPRRSSDAGGGAPGKSSSLATTSWAARSAAHWVTTSFSSSWRVGEPRGASLTAWSSRPSAMDCALTIAMAACPVRCGRPLPAGGLGPARGGWEVLRSAIGIVVNGAIVNFFFFFFFYPGPYRRETPTPRGHLEETPKETNPDLLLI